jgi:hypothetical protein
MGGASRPIADSGKGLGSSIDGRVLPMDPLNQSARTDSGNRDLRPCSLATALVIGGVIAAEKPRFSEVIRMRQALSALGWLVLALLALALGWLYPGLPRAILWILAPFLAVIGLAIAVNCTLECVAGRLRRRRQRVRAPGEDTCTSCGGVLVRADEIWVCARCDRMPDPARTGDPTIGRSRILRRGRRTRSS